MHVTVTLRVNFGSQIFDAHITVSSRFNYLYQSISLSAYVNLMSLLSVDQIGAIMIHIPHR